MEMGRGWHDDAVIINQIGGKWSRQLAGECVCVCVVGWGFLRTLVFVYCATHIYLSVVLGSA